MALRSKRIYEPALPSDGRRILVDRLWPRGVSKAAARVDSWAREVAPSNELRRWYRHDPAKWSEFRRRYFAELDANPGGVADLRARLSGETVTLVFSSKEERFNNASALIEYLEPTRRSPGAPAPSAPGSRPDRKRFRGSARKHP